MSSKIITTVIIAAIVGPFSYIATVDAVSIKQNLQEQTIHIEKLNTEYVKLDQEFNKTVEIKENTIQEVKQLEQEIINAAKESKKLEAELEAN